MSGEDEVVVVEVFLAGVVVGVYYFGIRVDSPAPPLAGLAGLAGMLAGQELLSWLF